MLYFDWLIAMIFFANFKRICVFFPPRDISDQDPPEPQGLGASEKKIKNKKNTIYM